MDEFTGRPGSWRISHLEETVKLDEVRNMNYRLLLLDDDHRMSSGLFKLLSSEGFDVSVAGSVQEGLRSLENSFYDLVVTDIMLPDGSGLEILRYCSEYCKKTKVICITGDATVSSVVDALRLGAHDYVTKPFNFDILLYSIRSVLDKMRMEEEIGLERERYRALVEDLKDGYLVVEKGRVAYANQAMLSLLKSSSSDICKKEFVSLFPEYLKERVAERLDAFSRGEVCMWHEELVMLDETGNEVTVDIKFSTSHMAGDGCTVVGICREVTDRDILWDRMVKAEKFALMGEMTAGIVHELNNKLTPVLGFVELLRIKASDPDNAIRIDAIHSAALAAREIVKPLLTFARKTDDEARDIDMNRLIDTSLSMVQASFSTSSVEIQKFFHAESPIVRVDAVQIEQVLTNIFKNAFEAMDGEGTLTVECMELEGEVAVRIGDTGPGIPREIRERIFKPFFTTKQRGNGTGLGLSICRGIIQKHGGNIWLKSDSTGTTFIITLPAAAEGRSRVSGGPDESGRRSGGILARKQMRSMLVVDDERDIGRLIGELFAPEFRVDHVTDGRRALERLRSRRYDVIISDIKMPVLDGTEFYEAVRTAFPSYTDRIVFTTGVTSDPRTSVFFKETGVPYLSKPFKLEQLVDAVNSVVGTVSGRMAA